MFLCCCCCINCNKYTILIYYIVVASFIFWECVCLTERRVSSVHQSTVEQIPDIRVLTKTQEHVTCRLEIRCSAVHHTVTVTRLHACVRVVLTCPTRLLCLHQLRRALLNCVLYASYFVCFIALTILITFLLHYDVLHINIFH